MKDAGCFNSSFMLYGKIARTPCKNTVKIFICVYEWLDNSDKTESSLFFTSDKKQYLVLKL